MTRPKAAGGTTRPTHRTKKSTPAGSRAEERAVGREEGRKEEREEGRTEEAISTMREFLQMDLDPAYLDRIEAVWRRDGPPSDAARRVRAVLRTPRRVADPVAGPGRERRQRVPRGSAAPRYRSPVAPRLPTIRGYRTRQVRDRHCFSCVDIGPSLGQRRACCAECPQNSRCPDAMG